MDFIYLGRSLDKLAKSEQYNESPDDVTKLILGFTGNIKSKSTMMFKISFQFTYDHYERRWGGSIDNVTYTDTLERRNCLGYRDFVYCACCQRTYAGEGSVNNHLSTILHKGNLTKDTSFSNTKVIRAFFVKSVKRDYRKNCKLNKKGVYVKEIWNEPYQYHE